VLLKGKVSSVLTVSCVIYVSYTKGDFHISRSSQLRDIYKLSGQISRARIKR
jgi:hypothetical protein